MLTVCDGTVSLLSLPNPSFVYSHRSLLEGLSVNPNVTGVNLDVSNNELGVSRDPGNLAKVLARTNCLREINLSSSGLDGVMPEVVEAISTNTMLRHVLIGKNFNSKPQ